MFTSANVGSSSSSSSPLPPSPDTPHSFFGHEFFQRDNKALLSQMKSVTAEGRRRREAASIRSADPYGIASTWQQQQLQRQQHDPQQHQDQGMPLPQIYSNPWNAVPQFPFPFAAASLPHLLAPSAQSATPAPAVGDPGWSPLLSPPSDAAAAFTTPPTTDPTLLQLLLLAAGAGTNLPGGSNSVFPNVAPLPWILPPAQPPPLDAAIQSLPGPSSDGVGGNSSGGELLAALLEQLRSNQAAMAAQATAMTAAPTTENTTAVSAELAPPNAPYGIPPQPPPPPPPP